MQKTKLLASFTTSSVKSLDFKAAAILGIKNYSAVTVFSDEDEDTGNLLLRS
jgi:hypothetical protein